MPIAEKTTSLAKSAIAVERIAIIEEIENWLDTQDLYVGFAAGRA